MLLQSTAELGRPLEELSKMTKHETKNDEFKARGMLPKGVSLPDSSAETSVIEMERSRQQSSSHILNSHPSNIAGANGQSPREGQSFLGLWMRISLRAQRHPSSVFQNLLLHINEETLREAYGELDGDESTRSRWHYQVWVWEEPATESGEPHEEDQQTMPSSSSRKERTQYRSSSTSGKRVEKFNLVVNEEKSRILSFKKDGAHTVQLPRIYFLLGHPEQT